MKDHSGYVPFFVLLNQIPIHKVIYSAHSYKEKFYWKGSKKAVLAAPAILTFLIANSERQIVWTIFSLLLSQGDCVHWIAYSFWLPKNQVSILILFNMKADFNNPSHEVLLACLLIILLSFPFSYGSYSRSQKILWNDCSKVAAEFVPWNPDLPICLTFTWPPSSVIQIAEGLESQHLCNRSCKSSYEYACVLAVITLLLYFCCEYKMCIS